MNEMNLKKWLGVTIIMLMAFTVISPKAAKADHGFGVSFQVFYDELSPYGDWIEDPRYGYIWLPYVDRNFHPYGTNGHWVMTEFGNTWVSYYDWGWAPFHYGRWFFDDYYGWAWVPGYDWGPAWVNWRTGGGYYGWAPLGPGVSINVSINIPSFHWVFVPRRRFMHRHVYRYYAPHTHVVNIYNRTTIINNTVVYNNNRYIAGPGRREVERYNRSRVPVYRVNSSRQPGRAQVNRDALSLYRPQLRTNSNRQSYEGRPSRVISAERAQASRSSATRGRDSRSSQPSYSNRSSGANRPSGTVRGSSSNSRPVAQPRSNHNATRGNSSMGSGRDGKTVKAAPYHGNRNDSGYSRTSPQTRSDNSSFRTRSNTNNSAPNARSSSGAKTNRTASPSPSRSNVNTKASQPTVRSRSTDNNRSSGSSRVSRSGSSNSKSSQSASSSSRRSGNSRGRGNN